MRERFAERQDLR